MEIINYNGVPGFNIFLPLYNWFYPLVNRVVDFEYSNPLTIYNQLETNLSQSRALYFHIPYCTSICNFCSFVRKKIEDEEETERYTDALTKEIKIKSSYHSVSNVPVRSIFFGGGSPSTLTPSQIIRIGKTIQDSFDLSQLQEFSFEMSALHFNDEKLAAMKEIGITHVRFGVQSFNKFFRKCFGLTSDLHHIYNAAEKLPKIFPFVSFDMLYGMNGQTEEEFFGDLEKAVELGMDNIAFYPINNLATQLRLHKVFKKYGRLPTSGLTKFYMNAALKDFMRSNGYLPHNGHEYVKVPDDEIEKNPVVTEKYSFIYHEHVYGYRYQEVIGFGPNAMSCLNGYVLSNTDSIAKYIHSLLNKNLLDFTIGKHSSTADESRGIILRLPYHGAMDKTNVNWNKVDKSTLKSLRELIKAEFVRETEKGYELTEHGWLWYVNLIYYLCPKNEKFVIDNFIAKSQAEIARQIDNCINPYS